MRDLASARDDERRKRAQRLDFKAVSRQGVAPEAVDIFVSEKIDQIQNGIGSSVIRAAHVRLNYVEGVLYGTDVYFKYDQ